ncbi:MAG TPA: MerR family transcriptional regulator [Bryobacteraceae bacterium]
MNTPDEATALAPALEPPGIPDKLYFRIGEVSRLAGIKPYVLRFWETEFPFLGPKKSGTGQRMYRRKDVELVLEIKRLLYEQRFTIEGARNLLDARSKAARAQKSGPTEAHKQGELFGDAAAALETVRKELREIVKMLK